MSPHKYKYNDARTIILGICISTKYIYLQMIIQLSQNRTIYRSYRKFRNILLPVSRYWWRTTFAFYYSNWAPVITTKLLQISWKWRLNKIIPRIAPLKSLLNKRTVIFPVVLPSWILFEKTAGNFVRIRKTDFPVLFWYKIMSGIEKTCNKIYLTGYIL